MARTISQIAGEFGLARGAAGDPFAAQEEAVLKNVQQSLADIRSQQLESAAARGFGRSSFTEGAFARQTADVLGQVGQQFAQARTQEALAERQFERGLISEQLGADVQSRLLQQQSQQRLEELGAQAGFETGLIGERAAQQRLTLQEQISGELSTLRESGEQARLTQQERFQGEQGIIAQQAQIRADEINLKFDNELEALNARFDRIRQDLPFELEQKARFEKEVLQKKLEVQREQQLIDTVIQTSLNYLLGNLRGADGITGGLSNVLEDITGLF